MKTCYRALFSSGLEVTDMAKRASGEGRHKWDVCSCSVWEQKSLLGTCRAGVCGARC